MLEIFYFILSFSVYSKAFVRVSLKSKALYEQGFNK